MAKDFQAKAKILKTCRDIISQDGINGLNMRKVAKFSNLAIGTVYYYFPSKESLITASIESVWEDIFMLDNISLDNFDTCDFVKYVYENIKKGMKKYPNFLSIHALSLSNGKDQAAKELMDSFLLKIEKDLIYILNRDKKIKEDVFDDTFSKESFSEFIITNIISVWLTQNSPETLLKVINKTLY